MVSSRGGLSERLAAFVASEPAVRPPAAMALGLALCTAHGFAERRATSGSRQAIVTGALCLHSLSDRAAALVRSPLFDSDACVVPLQPSDRHSLLRTPTSCRSLRIPLPSAVASAVTHNGSRSGIPS